MQHRLFQSFCYCSSKGCSLIGFHFPHCSVSIDIWLHVLRIFHSFSLPIILHLILEYQVIHSSKFGYYALRLLIDMPYLPHYLMKMNFGTNSFFPSYEVSHKTCGNIVTTFMDLLSTRLPFHTTSTILLLLHLLSKFYLCQHCFTCIVSMLAHINLASVEKR
jgi:hypothetical protein